MPTTTEAVSVAEKLSFKEKAGYGFGDAAANFVFQTMLYFQLGFCTDVFGISAAAAGMLLLSPWVLWSAIPFAVIFFLAFTTPGFEGAAKLVYAYIPTTREIQP